MKNQDQISKVQIAFQNAMSMLNHSSVCELLIEVSTMKIICYDIEGSRMYYYNTINQLYTEMGIKELALKVAVTLKTYLSSETCMKTVNITESAQYNKLCKSVGNVDFIKNVSILLCGSCNDREFVSKLNYCKSTINFKNGLVDLKTLQFRTRTINDYVSKCLDYDYSANIDSKLHQSINQQILNICNDSEIIKEDNMKWFGYCMTGETKQQKFLCTIGHSAQNGKSTLAKMFDNALSIYSIKLDKSTFAKDNTKKHKQFSLVKQPVRYVYIEELDRNKLDGDVLKDFVDGDKINTEIMYGTSENILLQCKLNLLSNNNVNFDTDSGIKRRGYSQQFTNRFISEDDYKKLKSHVGVYVKDESILDLIRTPAFKLAFCQMIMPYAQMYYKSGLTCSSQLTDSFNDLCEDNDKMQEFVTRYYDITGDSKDKIHKDTFLEHYRMITNLRMITWQNILNDVKRIGLNYVRNLSSSGQQGCLVGIRLKHQMKDQDCDDIDFGITKPVFNDFAIQEPIAIPIPAIITEKAQLKKQTIIVKGKKSKRESDMLLDCFD